jgi:hypothetical protein
MFSRINKHGRRTTFVSWGGQWPSHYVFGNRWCDDQDNSDEFTATLKDVMYVPGLSQRLFSITKFAHHGHTAVIKNDGIQLYFTPHQTSVKLSPISGINNLAADIWIHENSEEHHAIPSAHEQDHTNYKRLSLELLHNRLGHRKCCIILTVSEDNLWEDVTVCMSPETGCLSCGISTIQSTARNKEPHIGTKKPGEYMLLTICVPIRNAFSTILYAFRSLRKKT